MEVKGLFAALSSQSVGCRPHLNLHRHLRCRLPGIAQPWESEGLLGEPRGCIGHPKVSQVPTGI